MNNRKLAHTSSLTKVIPAIALAAGVLAVPLNSIANPEDGVVTSGSATIEQSGKKLNVHQSSDRVLIDWRSFDIELDETTQFYQPGSTSVAVNRINSNDPTKILGNLIANGNLVLINQNGIMFGESAKIDVNGIVATTASISTQNFENGQMKFEITGKPDASVINKGLISAKDAGLVGLVAPNVENHGVISAKLGKIHLASGDSFTLDLYGDGLIDVKASDALTSQLIKNTGKIEAAGGNIKITASAGREVVNSLIDIKGELKAPTVSKVGGKIIIGAASTKAKDSTVLVQAKIDASGTATHEQGGNVEITADRVALLEGTKIDVSGFTGLGVKAGGTIKIGGDYLGGGDMQRALRTIIQDGVELIADAFGGGDAGKVIIWSDERTDFSGKINAVAEGAGTGGFVETSSKQNLLITESAVVKATSESGNSGTWLLDPYNITIQSTAGSTAATGNPDFTANGAASYILVSTIQDALNANTNVTITTNVANGGASSAGLEGNITVANAIGASGAVTGTGSLTLSAYGSINVNAAITTKGAITLQSNNADNGGRVNIAANITSNNNDIIIGGGSNITTGYATGISGAVEGVKITTAVIDAGTGSVTIRGKGFAGTTAAYGTYINTNSTIKTTSGNISITGLGGTGGTTNNYGLHISGGTKNYITTTGGDITLTGTGGGGSTGQAGIYILLTDTTTSGNGNITITGTGGTSSTASSYGISYTGLITTTNGLISIDGTGGGTGAGNTGTILTGATVRAGTSTGSDVTGTGKITIKGTGSTGNTNSSSYGTHITSGTTIQTSSGEIAISGTGGGNGSSTTNNYGVYMATGTNTIGSLTGNIGITGTGGNGTTGQIGIYAAGGVGISTGADGTITLNGTAGTTSTGSSYGISYTGTITSVNGLITIAGTSLGTGNLNTGTLLTGATVRAGTSTGSNVTGTGGITITGTGSNVANATYNNYGTNISSTSYVQTSSGAINITGDGGGNTTGGTTNNYGVYIATGTNTISSLTGSIGITGTGGKGTTGATGQIGIYATTAVISTGGSGTVTLTGTGGASSTGSSDGINYGGSITTVDGLITIDGTSNATGNTTSGVQLNAATIRAGHNGTTATGSGGITIKGNKNGSIGGQATYYNYGVYVLTTSTIQTSTGAISITGNGAAGANAQNNHGVYIAAGTNKISTTTGNIFITGAAKAGTYSNYGVYSGGGTNTISTSGGNIQIVGTSNGSTYDNVGVYIANGSKINVCNSTTTCGAGAITIIGTGSMHASATTGNLGIQFYNGSGAGITAGGDWGIAMIMGGTGQISLIGKGGKGTTGNKGIVSGTGTNTVLGAGAIFIQGTGGGSGTNATDNDGVYLSAFSAKSTGSDTAYEIQTDVNGDFVTDVNGVYVLDNTKAAFKASENILTEDGKVSVLANGAADYIPNATIAIIGKGSENSGGSGVFINSSTNGAIETTTGTIGISGKGGLVAGSGASSNGVYLYNTSNVKSTSGHIVIYGEGAKGATNTSANGVFAGTGTNTIKTDIGDIYISGIGYGGSGSNGGVYLSAVNMYTTGTSTPDAGGVNINLDKYGKALKDGNGIDLAPVYSQGDIIIYGQGSANGTSGNVGVFINTVANANSAGLESKGTGLINITGVGYGSTTDNYGVRIYNNSVIKSLNTKIQIKGTGSSSGSSSNHGIYIDTTANKITTTTGGDIILLGYGKGTSGGNGIFLNAATTIEASATSGTGDIYLEGIGSDNVNATTSNYGIQFYNGVTIRNDQGTGTTNDQGTVTTDDDVTSYGKITIVGTAAPNTTSASATGNYGVYTGTGTNKIYSKGKISITATGNGKGATNGGAYLAAIDIQGKGSGSADYEVEVVGKGSTAGMGLGIFLTGTINTTTGKLRVEGVGGTGATRTAGNNGIYMYNGGYITSTSGAIEIKADGGAGTNDNYGLYLQNLGTANRISSTSGNVTINATGGGNGTGNIGMYLGNASVISTGITEFTNYTTNNSTSTLTILAKGSSAGTNSNYGAFVYHSSQIRTSKGKLDFQGEGGGNGTNNYGIQFDNNGAATNFINTDTAEIYLKGTGGNGTSGNLGIYTLTGALQVKSNSGAINIIGIGQGSAGGNGGMVLQGATVQTGSSANINITGTGSQTAALTTTITGNYGIFLDKTLSFITDSGELRVTGIGGKGNNSANGVGGNSGIYMGTENNTRKISSTSGNIYIDGKAHSAALGGNNYGTILYRLDVESNNAGIIDIKGEGSGTYYGTGISISTNSNIKSLGTGAININGKGTTNTSANTDSRGVHLGNANPGNTVVISSVSGAINIEGTGGSGTNTNIGVHATSPGTVSITSTSGDIGITGTSNGKDTSNYGVALGVSTISTGVSGKITITGTGSAISTGTYNMGVSLSDSTITTVNGALDITGQGGKGTNYNHGLDYGNSNIQSTGSGIITIKGTGLSSTSGYINYGINSAGVTGNPAKGIVSNTGNIIIQGTSGTGGGTYDYWNIGSYISGNVSSTSGSISITGQAIGTTGWRNTGLYFGASSTVKTGSTGTISLSGTGSANALGNGYYNDGINASSLAIESATGKILLDGTSGKGSGYDFANAGITMGGSITTAGGDIELIGDHKDNTTGNNTGSVGYRNYGVAFGNMAITTGATGSGSVTITGETTTAAAGYYNYGIYASGTLSIKTNSGNINLVGDSLSGSGNGSLDSMANHGIYLVPATTKLIESTTGNINITGTVSSAVTGVRNIGTYISGVTIQTGSNDAVNPAINITGTGYGANTSYGVFLTGSTVKTTGTGALKITGTGGVTNNSTNYGIYLTGSTGIDATGGGSITLKGTAPAASQDIYVVTGTNTIGSTNVSNYIKFDADSLSLANLTIKTNSSNNVIFTPRTASKSIGVAGASGNLQITTGILDMITAGKTTIGSSDGQGDIKVNSRTWTTDLELLNGSGNISIDQAQTLTGKNFSAHASNGGNIGLGAVSAVTIFARTSGASSGDITLNGNQTATGTGDAIVLAAGDDFHHTSGALSAANGRWLVYSTRATDNTGTALTADFTQKLCTYGSCSVPGSGNGLLYSAGGGVLTVTAVAVNATYGDTTPTYTYNITGYAAEDVGNDTVLGSAIFTSLYSQGSNAGQYNITFGSSTLTSSLGYDFEYNGLTNGLTVAKKDITASFNGDVSRTYGDANPTLLYSNFDYVGLYNGADKSAFTANGNFGAVTANTDIGTYSITATLNGGTNYNITNTPSGNLVIGKRNATISVDDKSKTYGDADPAFTNTNGLTAHDQSLVTIGYNPQSYTGDAGSYVVKANVTDNGGRLNNYNITYDDGDLTVGKRTITASLGNTSRTYGDANNTAANATITYGNLATGDNGGMIDSISYDFGAVDANTNIGTYDIGLTGFSDNNYTLGAVTKGNLTIGKRDLTVTTDDKSKTYGDADVTLTGSNNLTAHDAALVSYAYAADGYSGNAGVYTIKATATDNSNRLANYNITNDFGDLTVDKRIITASLGNTSRTYGDANNTAANATITYGNLATGDNGGMVDSVSYDFGSVDANTSIGTYDVGLTGFSDNNYSLGSVTKGNLTIGKRSATVTADDKSKTYGDADPTYTGSNNLTAHDQALVTFGYNPQSYTGDAGKYVIKANATDANSRLGNYNITYDDGELNVGKRALTATLTNVERTYGDSNSSVNLSSVTWGNLATGDNGSEIDSVTFNFGGIDANTDVGTYALSMSAFSDNNYTLDMVNDLTNGNLKITKRDVTISADDKSKTYGDVDPTLTGTNNLTAHDSALISLAYNAQSYTGNAGKYVIKASATDNSNRLANYNVTYDDGELNVGKRALTATLADKTKTYGDANPNLTIADVSFSNFASGEDKSLIDSIAFSFGSIGANTDAGTYNGAISLSSFTDNNYSLDLSGAVTKGKLTIGKRDITATIGNGTRVYGDTNPAMGWANVTWGNLVSGQDGSVIDSLTFNAPTATATANAGTSHAINISGFTDNNYNLTSQSAGNLSITKKDITATVGDKSKTYGSSNPGFSGSDVTFSGLVNGENASVLDSYALAYANSATTGANAGTNHAINVGSFSDNNYNLLSFTAGNLSIGKAALTITALDATKHKSDVNPDFAVNYSGFVNGDGAGVVSGLNYSTDYVTGGAVGNYYLRPGAATAANYNITFIDGQFLITADPVKDLPTTYVISSQASGITGSGNGFNLQLNSMTDKYNYKNIIDIQNDYSPAAPETAKPPLFIRLDEKKERAESERSNTVMISYNNM